VAALEWRIREDVPTNLRAVKKAALSVGFNGVMAARRGRSMPLALPKTNAARVALANDARGKVQWYRDETMEAYLTDK
jgi:hypothetical protein